MEIDGIDLFGDKLQIEHGDVKFKTFDNEFDWF